MAGTTKAGPIRQACVSISSRDFSPVAAKPIAVYRPRYSNLPLWTVLGSVPRVAAVRWIGSGFHIASGQRQCHEQQHRNIVALLPRLAVSLHQSISRFPHQVHYQVRMSCLRCSFLCRRRFHVPIRGHRWVNQVPSLAHDLNLVERAPEAKRPLLCVWPVCRSGASDPRTTSPVSSAQGNPDLPL